jgi:hypothetical protein
MPFKRAREGLLIIDNRESPGVGAELAVPAGAPLVKPGQMFQSATVTCSHCNRVVVLNPMRTRPRGYCARCDHYVCDSPECNRECVPFQKVLDELQEQAARNLVLGVP